MKNTQIATTLAAFALISNLSAEECGVNHSSPFDGVSILLDAAQTFDRVESNYRGSAARTEINNANAPIHKPGCSLGISYAKLLPNNGYVGGVLKYNILNGKNKLTSVGSDTILYGSSHGVMMAANNQIKQNNSFEAQVRFGYRIMGDYLPFVSIGYSHSKYRTKIAQGRVHSSVITGGKEFSQKFNIARPVIGFGIIANIIDRVSVIFAYDQYIGSKGNKFEGSGTGGENNLLAGTLVENKLKSSSKISIGFSYTY